MEKTSAIVLCAGQGTRMKSSKAKVLHELAGIPMCCWPLSRALRVADSVVAVVGHQAEEVKSAVTKVVGDRIRFVVQAQQRGTGDAVKVGLEGVPTHAETILVTCGDSPMVTEETLRSLASVRGFAKVALCTSKVANPKGYGRIIRDSNGRAACIIEEADASEAERQVNEVNSGVYAFDAAFLRSQIIAIQSNNSQEEFYLTDLVAKARELHGPGAVATLECDASEMRGINDRAQLASAEQAFRHMVNTDWMKKGVTMIDPATTYIDADVSIGQDVILHPGVILRGKTQIASGAEIFAYSVLEDSTVGAFAKVGPFARLRPGTVLEEKTRVGNFVETKKSLLRKGTKANHLAYIGDADIGEYCNIGAGTITCNYDGFKKHVTKIGDGTFIGSNTTLVAPLVIGERVYVAAGSSITDDVGSDDLAIGRSRQENKTGYASKIRDRLR